MAAQPGGQQPGQCGQDRPETEESDWHRPRPCLTTGQRDKLQVTVSVLSSGAVYAIDVVLYWQQWRLRAAPLDRVATAVRWAAADALLR
jgi:hypothetical protein